MVTVNESILVKEVTENQDKILSLFKLSSGRIDYVEKYSEKGDKAGKKEKRIYLEVKVFNDSNQLAGIVWYFGKNRAYIHDVDKLIERKQTQKVDMILISEEQTTSAGKRKLKENKITIYKNFEGIKTSKTKRRKKKKEKVEVKEVDIKDDTDMSKVAESDLLSHAVKLVQRVEPEIIKTATIETEDVLITDVKGYSSNKSLLAVYRTIDKKNVGVKEVRNFVGEVTDPTNITYGLIGRDKFTPAAKKTAEEAKIITISLKQEQEGEGDPLTQELVLRLVNGAKEILTYRGYHIINESDKRYEKLVAGSEKLGAYIIAERDDDKIMALIPTDEVVRVATVRGFYEQMNELDISNGMIIAIKRFTYTANRECRILKISALRKNHPVFNIFNHMLVPDHIVIPTAEIRNVLRTYNCKLHQLPKIYEDDPAVVMIDAKVGNVIKIDRGNDNYSYRLVIRKPHRRAIGEEDDTD